MFESSKWMYSSGAASFYDHQIDGSLRFNASDSAYLSRTPSAGNRQKFTFSAWMKLGNFDNWPQSEGYIFSVASGSDNTNNFYFKQLDSGQLRVTAYSVNWRATTARYRDPSAWYHVVLACDSTQGTAQNRIRLYINGEEVTAWDINNAPSQNQNFAINMAAEHRINQHPPGYNYPWGGYMAEVNFVDGQQLAPTSFGETKSGVWIPKAYAGSYGSNGFYLKFAGNTNDSSGNGNNWTANNLSSYDYVPDSPTLNFCTWNPLDKNNAISLAQGNLQATSSTADDALRANFAIPNSGKWYFEMCPTTKPNNSIAIGIARHTANLYTDSLATADPTYLSGGNYSVNNVVGVAVNADSKTVAFYVNGSPVSASATATWNDGDVFHPYVMMYTSSTMVTRLNCGQDSTFAGALTAGGNSDANGYGDFKYAPPSGYLALCTANLPVAEAIDPMEDNSPQDYFNTVLYTGNGSTRSISGVGFSPDWIWFKGRSSAKDHISHDIVRGVHKQLFPHTVGNEETQTNSLTAFNSDGWSMGDQQHVNQSGVTYAAWCWDAGSSTVSNSDGATTSQVRANPDSGVSIVGWDAPSSGSTTVGHGLSSAPEMVICKIRNVSANWQTWHTELSGGTYTLFLNGTGGEQVQSDAFGAVPTSSVLNIGSDFSGSGRQNIAYAMHSVEGFSAFGKYIGNGSSDGPFVYTGFRPAFVITKPINTASSWCIHDSARTPANTGTMGYFKANTSDAELFNRFDMDLLSNGFKIKSSDADVNHSGGTVIYMAFAENPFKYANAR